MVLTPLALKFINLFLTGSSLQESLLQCLPGLLKFFTSLTQLIIFSPPISYSGTLGNCTVTVTVTEQSLKSRCLDIHLLLLVCVRRSSLMHSPVPSPNYSSYRADRGAGGAGGGLLLLVHQSLSSSLFTITPFPGGRLEYLGVTITFNSGPLQIFLI